jgi:hypothetical protein
MSIQLSRANSGTPLTTADYNSDNLIVETAVNSLLGTSSSGGTVTNFTEVDTDVAELFSASVSNPTTTPEITFSRISKAANLVYASPDGASGKPTMRALVSGDLPVVPFNKGGTGITTAMTDNKVLSQRSGTIKYTGITAAGTSRIVVTPTTDNFEIDIVPANIEINTLAATTPLAVAKGGTGQTSPQAAINSLTAVLGAGNEFVLTKDTLTGDAVYKAQATGIVTLNGLTGTTVTLGADNIVAGATNKWNATHTGDVTGSEALAIDKTAITGKTLVSAAQNDSILVSDNSDSGNLKKVLVSTINNTAIKTITSSPYSTANTDRNLFLDPTSTSIVVTTPDIISLVGGERFFYKRIAGGANTVVVRVTPKLIDGSSSDISLLYNNSSIEIVYNKLDNFYIVSQIAGTP